MRRTLWGYSGGTPSQKQRACLAIKSSGTHQSHFRPGRTPWRTQRPFPACGGVHGRGGPAGETFDQSVAPSSARGTIVRTRLCKRTRWALAVRGKRILQKCSGAVTQRSRESGPTAPTSLASLRTGERATARVRSSAARVRANRTWQSVSQSGWRAVCFPRPTLTRRSGPPRPSGFQAALSAGTRARGRRRRRPGLTRKDPVENCRTVFRPMRLNQIGRYPRDSGVRPLLPSELFGLRPDQIGAQSADVLGDLVKTGGLNSEDPLAMFAIRCSELARAVKVLPLFWRGESFRM